MPEKQHDTPHAALAARTSNNFTLAKVAALLLVVTGHFLPGTTLWPAVAVGLFLLAFGSGYFTAARYHSHFDTRVFWSRKLLRLGPGLLAVDVFLLVLFLVQGKPGIWTWQTPLNMVGLTGILNWFGIPNASPFGRGLWFLTLLLIFYAAYPLLRLASRRKGLLWATTAGMLAACAALNYLVPMGHMLWLTAWAFVFGVFAERRALSVSPWFSACAGLLFGSLLVCLNLVFGFTRLNWPLLVGVAVCTVSFLINAPIPRPLVSASRPLAGCMLEIYVLHTYLFIRPTGHLALDLPLTLACVVGVSWAIALAARLLRRIMMPNNDALRHASNMAVGPPLVSTPLPDAVAYEHQIGVRVAEPSELWIRAIERLVGELRSRTRKRPSNTMTRPGWSTNLNQNTKRLSGQDVRLRTHDASPSCLSFDRKPVILLGMTGGGLGFQARSLLRHCPPEARPILVVPYHIKASVWAKCRHVRDDVKIRTVHRQPSRSQPFTIRGGVRLLATLCDCIKAARREQASGVVAIGAALAVPLLAAGKILHCRTVYIESLTRVTKPSRTGRIISYLGLADRFYVQWPQAVRLYRRARYAGRLL